MLQLVLRTVCIVVLAIACHSTAAAQGNDAFSPAGGRSTLMGNTGVALGRDGSAPFYNPATIVRIRDERLAFAVNFYSLALTSLPSWHQPDALDPDRFGSKQLSGARLLDTNFRALPSTLCLFFTLEDLSVLSGAADGGDSADDRAPTGKKLALCFATLETEDFDSQAVRYRTTTPAGPSSHVQSILRRWGRTYVGPTYSVSLSPQLAIGASLQVVYSADSFGIRSESVSAQLDGSGVSSALSTAGSGRSFELTGAFGATYRLGRVTMGASLRLPSLHIYGDYAGTFTQSYSNSKGGEPAMSTLIEGSGSLRSAPPVRLALGIGIAADRLTLELDGALEVPLQHQLSADIDVTKSTLTADGVARSSGQERYAITGHTVFNPSFGMEYFFSKGLSMLTGVSANFSSLQALDPVRSVGNLVHARISHVAASLGLGSYWEGGELLFGLSFDYGFGHTLAVNPFAIPNDWSIVSLHSYSLLFVVAGSTKLSSIVRLVNAITHGGETESEQPAQTPQGEPLPQPAPQPTPAAVSGSDVAPINPDAREAEGVEVQAPQALPDAGTAPE